MQSSTPISPAFEPALENDLNVFINRVLGAAVRGVGCLRRVGERGLEREGSSSCTVTHLDTLLTL